MSARTTTLARPGDDPALLEISRSAIRGGRFDHLDTDDREAAQSWLRRCREVWVTRDSEGPLAFGALTPFIDHAAFSGLHELTVVGDASAEARLFDRLEERARTSGARLVVSSATWPDRRRSLLERGYTDALNFDGLLGAGRDVRLLVRAL